MMRIGFILSSFPCLSETFILSQIKGLIDKGHDLHILAENNPHETIIHADFQEYSLQKRTSYCSVSKKSKLKKRLSFLSKFLCCLFVSPLKTLKVFLHLTKEDGVFSYSAFNCTIPFLMRRYNIIHCHFGTIGHVGVLLKKMGLCKNLVTTFYGYDVSSFVKKRGKNCYCELFDASDRLLVLSQNMKKRLIELGAN